VTVVDWIIAGSLVGYSYAIFRLLRIAAGGA
jgi:hypothetical protein